jgi:hypothetical protein
MFKLPVILALSSALSLGPTTQAIFPPFEPHDQTLADHTISLDDRYPQSKFVNDIFKFNILLNTDYLANQKFDAPQKLNLSDLDKQTEVSFTLKPGQTFAFHDQVLDKYQDKVVVTTNSQFNSTQGFKTDGELHGDGVCHLASLLNWAASDAGLEVEAPTNHDFAPIPEIPKQYGTAIFYSGGKAVNAKQNLYITNTKDKDVKITLNYKDQNLEAKVEELN